jgi:hypothetical protein
LTAKEELINELLAKPIGPARAPKPRQVDLTREIEVNGNIVTATITDTPGSTNEGTALRYLEDEGLIPEEWEVTSFRKSEWGDPENPKESVSFTFKRRIWAIDEEPLSLDELLPPIKAHKPFPVRPRGKYGAIVALGDMQFGKIDGDGVVGTLERTIDCINEAADRIEQLRDHYSIGHIHVAWLGDHIEGFVSQNGNNAWRTPLSLNEQIRLTRRVMIHALLTFEPLAQKLTMAAVPGNHGEAVRFGAKGVTRFDDSHDTESLIAVADAAALNAESFSHVEFLVPDTDELTVVTDVAGTIVAHAHGHQWKPNQHFVWWKGQAFNAESAMHDADLLLAGHTHHEHIDTDGWRKFIQVPAMESESTWYRHQKGVTGAPGLILAITHEGRTDHIEVIRGDV